MKNNPKMSELVKPRFRVQWLTDQARAVGQTDFPPSITIPGRTMSIREIFDSYAKGIEPDVESKTPQYFGDLEIPEISDVLDIQEHREMLREMEREAYSELKDARAQLEDAQQRLAQLNRKSEAEPPSKDTNPGEATD